MTEIISLLTQQRDLCQKAADELAIVREALEHNSDGVGVTAAVHKLEPLLTEFGELNEKLVAKVAASGVNNLYEALSAQPASADKDAALRLFGDVERLQDKLKRDNSLTSSLLKRSKMFVDFHINVASQVQAEHTYGPPGTAENIKQGRKVFVADA